MSKKLSSELMTVFISMTVLVVLITSIVFTFLFADYALSEKETTLSTVADNLSELVAENEASTYPYNAKSISDYNLFCEKVLDSQVWIVDVNGVFDRINNSGDSIPYNAKELDTAYYEFIKRGLEGEPFKTQGFSGYFGEKTISIVEPIKSLTANPDTGEQTVIGIVAVHCPMASIAKTYNSALTFLIAAVIVAAISAVIVAFILSRYISKPITQMCSQAERMAEGDYSVRIEETSKNEIGKLSKTLNYLAETLAKTIGELKTERDKLGDLFNNVAEGIASFDQNKKPIKFNTAWLRLCPQNFLEYEDVTETLDEVLKEGETLSITIECADILKITASPIKEGKVITGVVLVAADITEAVRLEKTRREFVSNVSHEFRTPLTIIKGNTELLLDGAVTEPDAIMNIYERIESETIALENLVKDLLDVSRMKAGKIKLDCQGVDISEMAESISANMKIITDKKGINLVCHTKPLRNVWGDFDRLRQLFIIFIDNAIKFTPEGGTITVETSQVDNMACISISDTGKGIRKEDIPFIFERFYKVDKSRGGSSAGTGLGLSIASNIIELHGGGIVVESDLGKGTKFNIMLPFEESEGDIAEEE